MDDTAHQPDILVTDGQAEAGSWFCLEISPPCSNGKKSGQSVQVEYRSGIFDLKSQGTGLFSTRGGFGEDRVSLVTLKETCPVSVNFIALPSKFSKTCLRRVSSAITPMEVTGLYIRESQPLSP